MDEWPCPTGCGRFLRSSLPVCPSCWEKVPPVLQQAVTETWTRFILGQSYRWYEEYEVVRDEAIAIVTP